MTDVQLLPVAPVLRRAVIEEGWLRDDAQNRRLGWGRGLDGQARALEWFEEASANGMLGIYSDSSPLGWLTIDEDGERSARIDLYVDPGHRREGIATATLDLALKELFGKHGRLYRVSAEVLDSNRPAIEMLKSYGFKREGKRWVSRWVDGQPRDMVSLVLTRPLYKKRQKEGD